MAWFKRRSKTEDKPLCFHEWKVADFGVGYEYNGIDDDAYAWYVIGCEKCGTSRKVDEYEFGVMRRAGAV
jgi:hypothetical protein